MQKIFYTETAYSVMKMYGEYCVIIL